MNINETGNVISSLLFFPAYSIDIQWIQQIPIIPMIPILLFFLLWPLTLAIILAWNRTKRGTSVTLRFVTSWLPSSITARYLPKSLDRKVGLLMVTCREQPEMLRFLMASDGFWWLLMMELIPEGPHCARLATPSQLSLGFSSALIPLSWKLQLCKCVHAAVFKQLGNMERMLFLRLASVCHVVLISDSSATLWLDLAIGIVTEPPPKLILRPLSWCQSSPRRHFDYGRWQLIEELSNWRATMNRLGNCSINIDIDLNSVQPPLLEVQGQKPQLALRKRMNKATSWYIWKQNLNGFPISFSSSHSSMVASMASMASMASSSPSTLSCNTSGRFTSNAGSGWGRATQWQPSTSFTFRRQNGVKTEQNIGQCSIYSLGGMTQTLLGYMCDMSHATLW